MTYRDYLASPEFAEVKRVVFARADGTCERCQDKKATDPHHLKYSRWYDGEIDKPENIIAVCHPCHCKLHNKEK